MSTDLIVSYDGTANDDDALALGKMLAQTGASMALAYVRHSREFDPRREELAQHDAERRLEQGATWLGSPEMPQHITISASTRDGLERLAGGEQASVIVFGSDYRTPPGHAEPGMTAQNLLEGGSVAIAVASAGLRTNGDAAIKSIAVSAEDADGSAHETAQALAARLGATLVSGDQGADLIVVGSPATAQAGTVALSGTTRGLLNTRSGSVLVVPHGKPVLF